MSAPQGHELRGAVIGFGLAGSVFHAPLIDSTAGLTVATIVTGNPERAAEARANHPDADVVADAGEVFRRSDEHDFVVVATPNATHADLAGRSIDAGLPVVVDKPLGPDAPSAAAVAERAERTGVMLTVFLNRRWDSDHLTIARLLAEGRLGPVTRHESRFERWRPSLADGGAWREDTAPADGGGVLLDLGPHLVDQVVQLHGPAASVYAEIAHRRGGRGDDDAFLAIHHESGVESHIWASVVAAAPGPRQRVLGERGAYVVAGLDSQEAELRAGRRPGGAEPWGVEPSESWGVFADGPRSESIESERGDWPAFYSGLERALRSGGPPPVDPVDAVAVLAVLDAARRSAEGGTVERPPIR